VTKFYVVAELYVDHPSSS